VWIRGSALLSFHRIVIRDSRRAKYGDPRIAGSTADGARDEPGASSPPFAVAGEPKGRETPIVVRVSRVIEIILRSVQFLIGWSNSCSRFILPSGFL